MRFAFSLPDGPTLGGVTVWTTEMCNQLNSKGSEVSLIEHVTFNPTINLDVSDGVRRVHVESTTHADSPFIQEKDIRAFAKAYESQKNSLFIPNWANGTYAACAQLSKIDKTNMRVIGFAHTDEDLYYDWLCYYESIIHQFVCVSQEIFINLSRLLPNRVNDMVVKPYAVKVETELNRNYSDDKAPIKLIYAGRISQTQKRIFDLLTLIEKLEEKNVNYEFRIIGNGMEFGSFAKNLATMSKSTQKRVSLEPGLPPKMMAETWRSADVFISVSEYEGTSIAMLEAMGQGCVPVVTAVSGTQAVIADKDNGFLHSVGHLDSLAETIEMLAHNRDKVRLVGENAHKTIKSRYSYQEYVNWFLTNADSLWLKPDREWAQGKAIIPPKLATIKQAELIDALKGDPNSARMLAHKIMHKTRLVGPVYFAKGVYQKLFS